MHYSHVLYRASTVSYTSKKPQNDIVTCFGRHLPHARSPRTPNSTVRGPLSTNLLRNPPQPRRTRGTAQKPLESRPGFQPAGRLFLDSLHIAAHDRGPKGPHRLQNSSKGDDIGMIRDPGSRATKLHIGSFRHTGNVWNPPLILGPKDPTRILVFTWPFGLLGIYTSSGLRPILAPYCQSLRADPVLATSDLPTSFLALISPS